MCYSAEVQADLEKLMDRFKAEISQSDDIYFHELLKKGEDFSFMKEALHLPKAPRSNFFKIPGADNLFPFVRFFEWVEEDNKKRLVSFLPENREIMWAPCLWDCWENPEKTMGFYSFALITDDPPPEVSERGHDRCPIFLKEKYNDEWLTVGGPTTSKRSREEWYLLLKNKEDVFYRFEWAA